MAERGLRQADNGCQNAENDQDEELKQKVAAGKCNLNAHASLTASSPPFGRDPWHD